MRGLAAYKAIAEQNFPGICDRFETYARLPLTAIVEYRRPQVTNRGNDWGGHYVRVPIRRERPG